jgi:hypothetical protein
VSGPGKADRPIATTQGIAPLTKASIRRYIEMDGVGHAETIATPSGVKTRFNAAMWGLVKR